MNRREFIKGVTLFILSLPKVKQLDKIIVRHRSEFGVSLENYVKQLNRKMDHLTLEERQQAFIIHVMNNVKY